ncbi:hypothetical protein ACP4OV_016585 [Aristida adscensionis]
MSLEEERFDNVYAVSSAALASSERSLGGDAAPGSRLRPARIFSVLVELDFSSLDLGYEPCKYCDRISWEIETEMNMIAPRGRIVATRADFVSFQLGGGLLVLQSAVAGCFLYLINFSVPSA